MKALELSCEGKRVTLQLESLPDPGDMDTFMERCGRPMFAALFVGMDPERHARFIEKELAELA